MQPNEEPLRLVENCPLFVTSTSHKGTPHVRAKALGIRPPAARPDLQQHRRDNRQHAAGPHPAHQRRGGHHRRPYVEARVLQPDCQRQGPNRRQHDPGAGTRRQDQAWLDADRTHLGQHRNRARLRRRCTRLPPDPDHAGIGIDRAAEDVGLSRGRTGPDAAREGHERRSRARQRAAGGDARGSAA